MGIIEIRNKINDRYGNGSSFIASDSSSQRCDVIPTGSLRLDMALGVGGIPRGRIIEIFGPESCISEDTFIPFEVWSKDGKKRKNHKGGSIKRLYERFTDDIEGGVKQGMHLQHKDVKFYVKSVNTENSIVRNEVLDVVKTGKKKCYLLETFHGNRIVSTGEHKFLTTNGYVCLDNLSSGDTVFIHNNTRRNGRKNYPSRPELYVKYHPKLPTKNIVQGNKTYVYHRGQVGRLVVESNMNDMTLKEYLLLLNTAHKEEINKLLFLSDKYHVHHKDENFLNNNIENLQIITPEEHGRLHAKERHNNLRFVVVESVVKSIKPIGEVNTYDIKCAYPYNNYIANGIVVHNSGKTTLCQHIIAESQKLGGIAAFVDVEHALDIEYAKKCGVQYDENEPEKSLMISQPDTGEMALEIAEMYIRNGVDIVVIDSVAALVPKAEIEGDMGDSHMGLQARLMSQALRKLAGPVRDNNSILIFTNQLRQKIGVMFGNPETTTGGMALRFYASIRIDVRKRQIEKIGDEAVGNAVNVKIRKNKVAPPFKETSLDIQYNIGINPMSDLIAYVNSGIIPQSLLKRGGAWYTVFYDENGVEYDTPIKLQGEKKFREYLIDNPDFYSHIENLVRKQLQLPLVTI